MAQRARATKRTDTTEIVQGLRRIVKALHTYSQDVRNAYGLTGPQLWALKTLRHTGRMSTGRLAAALAVHQSSVSILVDRLDKRGLVRRIRGQLDHRFVDIELTKRGTALAEDAPEAAQGRLLLPRCHACGQHFFRPEVACTHCFATDWQWVEVRPRMVACCPPHSSSQTSSQ